MISPKTRMLAAVAAALACTGSPYAVRDPRPTTDAPPGAQNRQARRAERSNRKPVA